MLNFFPDQKGPIQENNKNLYSPSSRVLFFFLWMEKFIGVPQFNFAFQTVLPQSHMPLRHSPTPLPLPDDQPIKLKICIAFVSSKLYKTFI
jgi:hypothetical protein